MPIDIAGRLSDHWSRLSDLHDLDDFWSAATNAFADIGFDQAIYASSPGCDGTGRRLVDLRTSPGLSAWVDDYVAHDDAQSDPMFSYGVFLPGPIFTGADNLADYPYLSQAERAVVARAGDHGLRSGVAVPMLFPRPGTVGGWNLLSSAGKAETARLTHHLNGFLSSFATLVQSRLEHLDDTCPSPLSGREREVLLWLGRGLRTDQIAHRLDLKAVTVSLHLKNARSKLGARTREQALALAIAKGWIEP